MTKKLNLRDLEDLLHDRVCEYDTWFGEIYYDSGGFGGGTAIIRLFLNFYGYPGVHHAIRIIEKINKKSALELKFKSRESYGFEGWSAPTKYKPCYFIEKVPLNEIDCEKAISLLIKAKDRLYKKII